jgi:molecular chaperone HtpG
VKIKNLFMEENVSKSFQVNLGGVLDILSNHLYSSEQVFIRELLQNSCDAITARQLSEAGHTGEIRIDVYNDEENLLVIEDNGIGLKEVEVIEFLSSIGSSTKRGYLSNSRDSFIGQFGIGLLSCFMICDEIILITKSKDEKAIKWIGNIDGSYKFNTLEGDFETGTKVFIKARKEKSHLLNSDLILKMVKNYGEILPHKIIFYSGPNSHPIEISTRTLPWKSKLSGGEKRIDVLKYGNDCFDIPFVDYIEYDNHELGANGILYIYPYQVNPNMKHGHKIFLKKMLLSVSIDNVVPDWCFFIKCVLNVTNLRPTASRESLYNDENLEKLKLTIGDAVKIYIKNLEANYEEKLKNLISIHNNAFKQYALQDDDFFRLIAPYFEFESTQGRVELKSLLGQKILHISNIDEFRKVAPIAQAKHITILNSGYIFDAKLLNKAANIFSETRVENLEVNSFINIFEEAPQAFIEEAEFFFEVAQRVLNNYMCKIEIKCFVPNNITALYFMSEAVEIDRSYKKSIEKVDGAWGSVLSRLSENVEVSQYSTLCLNFNNNAVQEMSRIKDENLLESLIFVIYFNTLYMGHHSVTTKEMNRFNQIIINLIDWAVKLK